LNGPISTTTCDQIAQNFSNGGQGTVITFKDDVDERLKGFDCGCLSSFGNEKEVLFMGGHYPIRVVKFAHAQVSPPAKFTSSLEKFDYFLHGIIQESQLFLPDRQSILLNELIRQRTLESDNVDLDDNDMTFLSFCKHKTEITLNVAKVATCCIPATMATVYDLIFTDPIRDLSRNNAKVEIRRDIFGLFENLETIHFVMDKELFLRSTNNIVDLFHSGGQKMRKIYVWMESVEQFNLAIDDPEISISSSTLARENESVFIIILEKQ